MDPITALGVASAVVGFLEIGAQIAKRLEELSKVGDVPLVFRDVRTRLPLVLSIVSSIQANHELLAPDAQEAFESVVAGCYDQIKQVEKTLQRVTVAHGDSRWRKGLRAAFSLVEESRIQKVSGALRDNIELLSMFKVAPSEKSEKLGPRRPSTAGLSIRTVPPSYTDAVGIFMVPFIRDERFIGRGDALKEIEALFAERGRVSVAGVGGVGHVAQLFHKLTLLTYTVNHRLQSNMRTASKRPMKTLSYFGSTVGAFLAFIKGTKRSLRL